MGIYSLWNDPAQDAPNVQWVRRVWDAVQPHIPGGVYVNELGEDTYATPAIADGRIYVRTTSALYAFGK